MTDPVPAVAEAAATGETARIFADIRAVLGVEVVNLIWRHLAIFPGALPWAWEGLRPLYADGTLAAEAARLHRDLQLPPLPRLSPEVLTCAGLNEPDLATIGNVLSAYNRTNAMALLALSALLVRLSGEQTEGGAGAASPGGAGAEAGQIPLPKLLAMDEMAPATAQLVLALNRLGAQRDDPILASMYRHLAHWPSYLALAWTLVAPLQADGRLDGAIREAVTKARDRAAGIAGQVRSSTSVPSDPETAAAIRAAIDAFAGDVIVRMVVICALLRAATP